MGHIDKLVWKYLRQSIAIIAGISILLLLLVRVQYMDFLITPIIIGSVFAIAVELLDILLWRKFIVQSPDTLPIFFLGVSVVRLLFTLAVLFVYYFTTDGSNITSFFLTFMAYYFVIMLHHTIFFAKERTNS